MARPLRLDYPGALWHVTARGNERKPIYKDSEDCTVFVDVLGRTVTRYRWSLHAFVLMPNHYQLLVETPVATLSRGMRQLGGLYTQRFNRRWTRCGHLFQGRFFSLHVERESHLLELARYISLNPVRAGLAKSAAEWRWGSYRALAGLEPAPPFLETRWMREAFGSRRQAAARAFAEFVDRPNSYEPWSRVRHQVYLGSEEFCADRLGQARSEGEKSGITARQVRGLATDPDDFRKRLHASRVLRPGDRRGRNLVGLLLRDEALATWPEVGRAIGLTADGARTAVAAVRSAIDGNARLRQELEELKAALQAAPTART